MEFSNRRCKDTRKPALSECPDINFYYCELCKDIVFNITKSDKNKSKTLSCCGKAMDKLKLKNISEIEEKLEFEYVIKGGYNDNTVEFRWKKKTDEDIGVLWVVLMTFQGAYMKYVRERKPLIFALADLDAFAYCDADPCLECSFRCKRGFEFFIYVKDEGLYHLPLDKFSPYWQSANGDN